MLSNKARAMWKKQRMKKTQTNVPLYYVNICFIIIIITIIIITIRKDLKIGETGDYRFSSLGIFRGVRNPRHLVAKRNLSDVTSTLKKEMSRDIFRCSLKSIFIRVSKMSRQKSGSWEVFIVTIHGFSLFNQHWSNNNQSLPCLCFWPTIAMSLSILSGSMPWKTKLFFCWWLSKLPRNAWHQFLMLHGFIMCICCFPLWVIFCKKSFHRKLSRARPPCFKLISNHKPTNATLTWYKSYIMVSHTSIKKFIS